MSRSQTNGDGLRLGNVEKAALDKICRTNGGGVSQIDIGARVIRSLFKKGLIQGKSGAQYKIVHTEAGLNLWREFSAEGGSRGG